MSDTLINCNNISKSYRMGDTIVTALKTVSLTINYGEYVSILGPSGSGKSTLMNILGCLDKPTTGDYFLSNKKVDSLSKNELAYIRNQKIGFVFQSFNLLAHATALENVALPLVYRGTRLAERKHEAEKILSQVGLADRIHHMPNELSGGQRQRVAIARALVTNPDLVLADEPTGNLDSKTGNEIIHLFEKLSQAGKTIIIVTHDLALAKHTRRVIQIKDGELIEDNLQ